MWDTPCPALLLLGLSFSVWQEREPSAHTFLLVSLFLRVESHEGFEISGAAYILWVNSLDIKSDAFEDSYNIGKKTLMGHSN